MLKSNYSAIKKNCVVNGPGIRYAIFISGCNIHCKDCFNFEAWDFNYGYKLTENILNEMFSQMESDYIAGLSILGGEPMDLKNQETVAEIIRLFRLKFKNTKTIWLYTGYILNETIPKTDYTEFILNNIDTLVDGPFQLDKRDFSLDYRGSSNQRVINMRGGDYSKLDKQQTEF